MRLPPAFLLHRFNLVVNCVWQHSDRPHPEPLFPYARHQSSRRVHHSSVPYVLPSRSVSVKIFTLCRYCFGVKLERRKERIVSVGSRQTSHTKSHASLWSLDGLDDRRVVCAVLLHTTHVYSRIESEMNCPQDRCIGFGRTVNEVVTCAHWCGTRCIGACSHVLVVFAHCCCPCYSSCCCVACFSKQAERLLKNSLTASCVST